MNTDITPGKIAGLLVAIFAVLFTPIAIFKCWENLDAAELMVVQSPLSGTLTWHTTPGIKWQGWGAVTRYPRRSPFWFSSKGSQGSKQDESVKVRFNDNSHANISGSLSWEMPLEPEKLTSIHMKYGSEDALEHQLIRTSLEKSVYMTGPLMSSTESASTRRNELLGLIEDQFLHGVYKTNGRDERTDDPITGQKKTIRIVEPVKGKDGIFERTEDSALAGFGINAYNFSINEIKYDPTVEAQIQQQQESIMQVQSAIAKSKAAEQEVLTAKSQGEAEAAKAEWAQRVIQATAVTLAEQEKQVAVTAAQKEFEVAQLNTQSAEQKKLADILLGEGEATRRKLVMDADGALEKKLAALTEINRYYAEAIGNYRGNWMPSVVMGEHKEGVQTAGGANELINLLTAKTAKDLAVDLALPDKSGVLPEIIRPAIPKFQLKPAEKTVQK